MNTPSISFQIEDSHVVLHGHPELEGREGILIGDGIALFSGRRSNNYELYLVNTQTGKIRQLSTSDGELLVEDCDIDYTAIERENVNTASTMQRTNSYVMVDWVGGATLRKASVLSRGHFIPMVGILPIVMGLAWMIMRKR